MFFCFSCHIPGQTVFVSHFSTFFCFLAIIQVLKRVFLIFHVFHSFSPYSRYYSVCLSFSTFFQFSRHIIGQTVFWSHFLPFSIFLAIFPVLLWEFLMYFIFQFFAIFQVLQCTLLIFCLIQCFSPYLGQTVFVSHFPRFSVFLPYSRSNTVCVSFSTFFSFLAIFQVLECGSLTFHVFLCFLPYSR
jgi:hypothetical protein